jgi:hypothetical protein
MRAMSAQLDYVPTPRRHRLPWRWLGLIALLITGGLLVVYRNVLTSQARLRWTIGQCRTFTRPPHFIALESNTFHAAQLAARDSNYALLPPRSPLSGNYYRVTRASSYSWHPGEAYASVAPWDTLSASVAAPGPQAAFLRTLGVRVPSIPLFVHERTCKGRPVRLVVVELSVDNLQGFVLAPGYPWQTPTLIWRGPTHNLGETIPDTVDRVHNLAIHLAPGETPQSLALRQRYGPDALAPAAHIYFGQPDPNDAAKFTIRVEIGKIPFTFEGQLMPDDTVQIEGPLLSEVFKKLQDSQ